MAMPWATITSLLYVSPLAAWAWGDYSFNPLLAEFS